jgi:hypothetical protein
MVLQGQYKNSYALAGRFDDASPLIDLFLQKESVVRTLPSANFVGEISKKMLVNSMLKNELLLTDHCDDNDVCSIVGKCTVIDRPPEGAPDRSTLMSRFRAKLTRDQIRVTTENKGFLSEGKVTKRKVDVMQRREVHKSKIKQQKTSKSDSLNSFKPKPLHAKGERKNASRPSSDLWQIHGFSSLSQQKTVAKTISKLLPGDVKRCAFQVGSFFLFVNERQQIWERRNNGDGAPWSQCMVFNDYFFCNVSKFYAHDVVWSNCVQSLISCRTIESWTEEPTTSATKC